MPNANPTIISHKTNALPFTMFHRAPQTAIPGINLHCAPLNNNDYCPITRKPSIFRPATSQCRKTTNISPEVMNKP